jgi:hypothetical protein
VDGEAQGFATLVALSPAAGLQRYP